MYIGETLVLLLEGRQYVLEQVSSNGAMVEHRVT